MDPKSGSRGAIINLVYHRSAVLRALHSNLGECSEESSFVCPYREDRRIVLRDNAVICACPAGDKEDEDAGFAGAVDI